MRVLVTYGSKRGGTTEIATKIAETLRERGHLVDLAPASQRHALDRYDAVLVGGALYMQRWVSDARRFVTRHAAQLGKVPVWMFSSGPLDTSADQGTMPPPKQVARLMERIGARGHQTFGGRLSPDAKGFPASAMAKKHAGDWRNWEQVRSWATTVAHELESLPARDATRPTTAVEQPRLRRWMLATLCLVVGLTAIGGGVTLVAAPDGSLVHMPVSALDHSPFSSFLIPGLLLLLVIGGINTVAGLLVIARAPFANPLAFVGGAALLVWIATELSLLRAFQFFQVVYLVLAIVIMGASLERRSVLRSKREHNPLVA